MSVMSIIDLNRYSKAFQTISNWRAIVSEYQFSHRWRSNWQLINTLVPYVILWYLMFLSLKVGYWLTFPLLVLAAGLQMRLFIIFHDCGHKSFYKSSAANNFWGKVLGVITFTAYKAWSNEHAKHHATCSNLDKRGTGDVWTMTAAEYVSSSPFTKLLYRITRNSFFLFFLAPFFLFSVAHRFTSKNFTVGERRSVHFTNIAILGMIIGLIYVMGIKAYLLIHLPLLLIVSIAGVWLFYFQHQYEGVYWARNDKWDYVKAAMEGSSFYKLPKFFQWFTGNIGFHHIHHLSSRIPNYFLEKCHRENSLFHKIKPMRFTESLKAMKYSLWDEENSEIISFKELKKRLYSGKIKLA